MAVLGFNPTYNSKSRVGWSEQSELQRNGAAMLGFAHALTPTYKSRLLPYMHAPLGIAAAPAMLRCSLSPYTRILLS